MIRIIEEFRGLAWAEVKTKYLDYENCQILLIGEKVEKAVEPTTKDKKHDKDAPKEELEQLEHEDELRVEHLHGKDLRETNRSKSLTLQQATTRYSTTSTSARKSIPRFRRRGRSLKNFFHK